MKAQRGVGIKGSHKRVSTLALVLAALAWLSGCYQYVEVDPPLAPTGARARAALTPEAVGRVSQALTGEERNRLEGRIVEVFPDGSLMMEVAQLSGDTRVGISSRPLFSRVSLSAGELMGLELKQLNKGKTALLVGASGLVAAVIVDAAFDIVNGGDGEGGGPPVNEALIPLFSFRIGGR